METILNPIAKTQLFTENSKEFEEGDHFKIVSTACSVMLRKPYIYLNDSHWHGNKTQVKLI
jgi:hypothetical protein